MISTKRYEINDKLGIDDSPEDESLGERIKDWSQSTSCHGIPHAGKSHTLRGRIMWSLIVIICVCIFIYQSIQVYTKFQLHEKITSIDLVFENIEFPAVTFCNLNPYKRSKLSSIKEIDNLFKEYEKSLDKMQKNHKRVRRSNAQYQGTQHVPVYSACSCPERGNDCVQFDFTPPTSPESTCLCVYDPEQDTAWPCHQAKQWQTFSDCVRCKENGACSPPVIFYKFLRLNVASAAPTVFASCVCHLEEKGASMMTCLRKPNPIRNLWDIQAERITSTTTTAPSPPTTAEPIDEEFVKSLHFEGTNDETALVSKADENLIFAMASLSPLQRKELSYGKREFITKCSFNSEGCDVLSDFKMFNDATFGNCYTFNYFTNRTSKKAGPLYGLKVVTFVNLTEYLETSVEAGVRITIHDTTAIPFPDVFGFNAPTGYLSSFGVRLKRVNRLGPPYGNCTNARYNKDFIYSHYRYSIEGCQRSCYQKHLVKNCGCGDPRYPVLPPHKPCTLGDGDARSCLDRETDVFQQKLSSQSDYCSCQQSCEQWLYEVGFSAARWPSGSSAKAVDCDMFGIKDGTECLAFYRKHATMVDVYYERHGYEFLIESPAYGWVNALGDIGGHIGLYTGISVITCIEICVLFWDLLAICCKRRK